jgi:hypothetical protein
MKLLHLGWKSGQFISGQVQRFQILEAADIGRKRAQASA